MKTSKLVSLCQRAFGSRGVEIAIALKRVQWIKIIDGMITISSLIGIVMLTRSLGAFGIVVGFGLWNYWRGLSDQHEEKPAAQPQNAVITKSMIERVKAMPPGGAIRCICEKEQVEFIVIEASDFDHIVDMAGMVARDKD
jgi:ABC-type nickel/cobalt efflux system permease component RcnA